MLSRVLFVAMILLACTILGDSRRPPSATGRVDITQTAETLSNIRIMTTFGQTQDAYSRLTTALSAPHGIMGGILATATVTRMRILAGRTSGRACLISPNSLRFTMVTRTTCLS